MKPLLFILIFLQGLANAQSLEDYFPLKLFFANDEPNPKSLETTTAINYQSAYKSYQNQFEKYQTEGEYFNMLLENELVPNYEKLGGLKQALLDTLKTGKRIILQVKGFASPLHKTDYNINISKRRISCFKNELASNKQLQQYLKNAQLIIEELPFGEYSANPDANDQLDSLHLSVYHFTASYERRVEVEQVIILDENTPYLQSDKLFQEAKNIKKGEKFSTMFNLQNNGSEDINIERIAVSCGCSVVDIEKMLLKSGENTPLKLEIDTNDLPFGKAVKSFTVFYNNGLSKRFVVLMEVF